MQRVHVVADADEHHGRIADLHGERLGVVERVGVQRLGPVFRAAVKRRLVDADAEAEGEMAAEVPADGHHASAGERQRDAAPAPALAAAGERRRVAAERDGVDGRVHEPDAAHIVVDGLAVGPVAEAGHGRRRIGGDADGDQPPGGLVGVLAAEQVEQRGADPAADHDVGEDRVQRMPHPCAAEDVLQRARADLADGLAERLGGDVERRCLAGDVGEDVEWLLRGRSHGSPDTQAPGAITVAALRVAAAPMARTDDSGDATPFLPDPDSRSLSALREAAAGCRGCHLYAPATQTVFGDGRENARVMMVGEQPGDREDREGRPFVGPAGRELDRALEHAGIDRRDVYITNVVKHFKFEERGRRRIHQTPKRFEIDACSPWLREELAVVAPEVLVILGATAGKALLGSKFRLRDVRGTPIESDLAPLVTATIHPSAILRARDDEARYAEREAFEADLVFVARAVAERSRVSR